LKAEQKDALNSIVLLAYLQFLHLQSDGFLTTWSNSFVGPWDSSQGEHNPGNKLVITCITCLPLTFFSIFLMFGLNIFHIFLKNVLTDEKIKLWLFLPGHHSVVPETAQPAVSKLRGLFWLNFYDCITIAQCLSLLISAAYFVL
jgi:mediator of RNA polymerase II transcription subunit 13